MLGRVFSVVWLVFGFFLFCTTPTWVVSPSCFIHLWRGGNWSTQGVVHHTGLVRLVRLCNPRSKMPKKKNLQTKSNICELKRENSLVIFEPLGFSPLLG